MSDESGSARPSLAVVIANQKHMLGMLNNVTDLQHEDHDVLLQTVAQTAFNQRQIETHEKRFDRINNTLKAQWGVKALLTGVLAWLGFSKSP